MHIPQTSRVRERREVDEGGTSLFLGIEGCEFLFLLASSKARESLLEYI